MNFIKIQDYFINLNKVIAIFRYAAYEKYYISFRYSDNDAYDDGKYDFDYDSQEERDAAFDAIEKILNPVLTIN